MKRLFLVCLAGCACALYGCAPVAEEPDNPVLPDPLEPTGSGDLVASVDIGARAVEFSPDGSLFLAYDNLGTPEPHSNDRVVTVWTTHSREQLRAFRFDDRSNTFAGAFSPDGRYIVTAGDDIIDSKAGLQYSPVVVWDRETGEEVRRRRVFENAVRAVCFSPDGETIAFAGDHGYIGLWRFNTGEDVRRLDDDVFNSSVRHLEFSRDGSLVLTSPLSVWDVASGAKLLAGADKCYTFSDDGEAIFAGGYNAVNTIDPATGRSERWVYEGNGLHITALDLSDDGRYLASGYNDGSVGIWTTATQRLVCRLHPDDTPGAAVTSVRFSPDPATVVSADDEGTAHFWKVDY